VEVRVQYPHDERMAKPSWQAAFDRERSYIENWQPLVSVLLLAVSVLFTLGGILFVVLRYLRRGRDPKALVVPEYLDERPTEELPGIVGLLLDEKADMKDILATLVDLARRGYLVIEQTEEGGLAGLFTNTEFTFHRTGKPADDLRPYERTLLRGILQAHPHDQEANVRRVDPPGIFHAVPRNDACVMDVGRRGADRYCIAVILGGARSHDHFAPDHHAPDWAWGGWPGGGVIRGVHAG